MAKYRELLKNQNFVFYSVGQMVSQFADRLVHFSLIGIVYKIAPGSTFQLAKILFFTVIPAFFISPIAGVYVDRIDKKRILVSSDIIRGLMVALIPLFLLKNMLLVPIYCIVFVVFASACFFLPAKLSIIPDLVQKENYLIANSFSTMTWIIAGMIGFTLGAFLVEFRGVKNGLFINSFLYFLSAVILSFLPSHKKIIEDKEALLGIKNVLKDALHKPFFHELKDGILYILSHKNARFIVSIFFTFMSTVGALYVVTIVFIQELTSTMTSSIGIFGFFFFLGFLIGSYFYGKFGRKFSKNKAIFISFILSGISILSFAIIMKMFGIFLLGYIFLFLLGISMSPIVTSGNTIVHETIDEKMRGRVFSSIGIIMNVGFLIFMFLSSILAEHIGRMWIILIGGFIFSLIGVIGYKKESSILSS